MRTATGLLLTALAGLALGADQPPAAAGRPAPVGWPALAGIAHVAARAATAADVNDGRACFMLADDDGVPSGTPLPIQIPQYAIHVDETGREVAAIVVQAESSAGMEVIGARTLPGLRPLVGLLSEFRLLGSSLPVAIGRPTR